VFESIRRNYLKRGGESKSNKQVVVKEELLVSDKELELNSLNSTESKLSNLRTSLFNNPDIFN